ncbi:MAG: hypothetical protein WDN30_14720 [Pararobbsia sp.]
MRGARPRSQPHGKAILRSQDPQSDLRHENPPDLVGTPCRKRRVPTVQQSGMHVAFDDRQQIRRIDLVERKAIATLDMQFAPLGKINCGFERRAIEFHGHADFQLAYPHVLDTSGNTTLFEHLCGHA